MTQFKRKQINGQHSLLDSLIDTVNHIPNCYNWDDFLDFTRMSAPTDEMTFIRRITIGSSRFVGNYVCLWAAILFVAAIFIDKWFLVTMVTIPSIWNVIGIATVIEDYYKEKPTKEYIYSLKDRILLLAALSNFALIAMRVFKVTYMVSSLSFILMIAHSGMRPIPNEQAMYQEYMKKKLEEANERKKTKVEAPDGFIDEMEAIRADAAATASVGGAGVGGTTARAAVIVEEEEETVVFGKEVEAHSTLTQRKRSHFPTPPATSYSSRNSYYPVHNE